jgi:hypothetical protein
MASSLRLGSSLAKCCDRVFRVVVLRVLDDRRHRFDLAHPVAHQKKLIEDEKRGLARERRNLLDLGIVVIAVADRAKLVSQPAPRSASRPT